MESTKKVIFLLFVAILFSCSDDGDSDRLMYDITYRATASNGATLNKVEYMNDKGNLVELTDVSSPWSISLRVRAGLALEARAYGDIPYQGVLSISANWTPEGGATQSESQTLPNDTPDSTIDNGMVEISGRTLPD